MKNNQMKRAVCYTMAIVCLGAAALLPFCAVPVLRTAMREHANGSYTVNYTALFAYFFAAAVLAAVSLFLSCRTVLRTAEAETEKPKPLVILGQWLAVPINGLLCFTCALWERNRWEIANHDMLVFWPFFAIVLILCAMLFVRALNKDLPD